MKTLIDAERGHYIAVACCTPDTATGAGWRHLWQNDAYHGARQGDAVSTGPNHQFRSARPNVLWLSDFTLVHTWQGFVYLAFVIDEFARRIVGWRGRHRLCCRCAGTGPACMLAAEGLTHHCDRGVRYVAMRSTQRLKQELFGRKHRRF